MMLFVATTDGLLVCERGADGWLERQRGLAGREVTSVIAREGVILAGTTEGVFRSDDLGERWRTASRGLSHPHVRWLAYHPEISDREFAGTEPATIFVSQDGAESWRSCGEVEALRAEHGWYLPYSPRAGCVRDFAFNGSRVYAAVEVGGVLRSDDGGHSWRLVGGSTGSPDDASEPPASYIASDVHAVAVHPTSPEMLSAATNKGLYHSTNGGDSWHLLYPNAYCRALWLDPADPEHIIFSPASEHGWHGRIEETHDGGQQWHAASAGWEMPPHVMVERFTAIGEELFAVLSDGQLIATPLDTRRWRRVLPQVTGINAVTMMEGNEGLE